jgi:4-amino-4-deoxy-L-arabinose transferase-like glycosyltransferase
MSVLPRKISKKSILLLGLIFAAALFIRFQYVHLAIDEIFSGRDARQYLNYANNLVYHGIFSKSSSVKQLQPDSFRSPGYPLFVALTILVGGEQKYLPLLIYTQAALSALLVPLTFFSGIFFLPAAAAMVATIFVAFSPHLITITGCVLTETLTAFLLLTAMCCFQYAWPKKSISFFILSAFFFGCTYLTNETVLFLPLLLVAISVVLSGSGRIRTFFGGISGKIAIFIIIFSFFPFGWALRNQIQVTSDAPKGMDRAIATLSHGTYPGFIYKNPRYKRFPYREDPLQPAFGSSFENFTQILWSRVKKEPYRYAKWYIIEKPYYFWSWDIIQGVGDIYIYPVPISFFKVSGFGRMIRTVMKLLHPFCLLLVIVCGPGLYYKYRSQIKRDISHSSPVLPFTVCIYFTAIYMIFAPLPRYSIPLRPELYLCAVWSGAVMMKLIAEKWRFRDAK